MDLRSIVDLLDRRGDELLEQDRKNRLLLDGLLDKHKRELDELEKEILSLEERPLVVRIAPEGEPAMDGRKMLEARKAKNNRDLTELKYKITLMERERESVSIDLQRVIDKLNNLTGNQDDVEEILEEAMGSI